VKIIITEEQKKKLFIPRRIDSRVEEFEKLRDTYIKEIKEIIFEEGEIDMGELEGDSPTYEMTEDTISFITSFGGEEVTIVKFNSYDGVKINEFKLGYDELTITQLFEIRELLETYDPH
jgi:hypothetical protein